MNMFFYVLTPVVTCTLEPPLAGTLPAKRKLLSESKPVVLGCNACTERQRLLVRIWVGDTTAEMLQQAIGCHCLYTWATAVICVAHWRASSTLWLFVCVCTLQLPHGLCD